MSFLTYWAWKFSPIYKQGVSCTLNFGKVNKSIFGPANLRTNKSYRKLRSPAGLFNRNRVRVTL